MLHPVDACGKMKEKENAEKTFGFIFLCSGETKPECYRYRVFGLPQGQLDIVEKIEPGIKLFLFDFRLKLLYGIYTATSNGEMNLEPAAFGGKFPAQVRFKIFNDCLPLPERAFKHAIKDNYQGSKFRQELSSDQVKNLVSLFRPIDLPPSISVVPTVANVAMAHTFPAPTTVEKVPAPAGPPPIEHSYWSSADQAHTLPVLNSGLNERHEFVAHGVHVQSSSNNQYAVEQAHLPGHYNNPYYSAEAPHAYLPEKAPLSMYDPYRSCKVSMEMDLRNHGLGYENQYCMSQLPKERDTVLCSDNVANYYSQYPSFATTSHVLLQAHPLAPSYALPTSSNTQALPFSYSSYHAPPTEDHSQVYVDPIQRSTLD